MKNRRTIIVAFLVMAMLVTGIGYAAVTGSLNVTGDAAFYGYNVLTGNVATAIGFIDAESLTPETCTVDIPPNDRGIMHSASMDVNFYDNVDGASGNTYTAKAKFVIEYANRDAYGNLQDANLPPVLLGTLASAINPKQDEGRDYFGITATWTDEDGNPIDSTHELVYGESVILYVTVEFDSKGQDLDDKELSATIDVALPYTDTVANP